MGRRLFNPLWHRTARQTPRRGASPLPALRAAAPTPTAYPMHGHAWDPHHPDVACRAPATVQVEQNCNLYSQSTVPVMPLGPVQISEAVAPALLSSAGAPQAITSGPGPVPTSVPVPGAIPKPKISKCTGAEENFVQKAWEAAYVATLYAYTMIDFIYQASLVSKDWASCLWYENEYGTPHYRFGAGYLPALGLAYPAYWFGYYETLHVKSIRIRYAQILASFEDGGNITLLCENNECAKDTADDTFYACASDVVKRKIYLTQKAIDRPLGNLMKTLIHEVAHLDPPSFKHTQKCKDEKGPFYGHDESVWLAENCPSQAFINSDNYAMLAVAVWAAIQGGGWWNLGTNQAYQKPFAWGQTCPRPHTGGGTTIPEPCIWEWDPQMKTTTCVAIPEKPDFGEPSGPGTTITGPPGRTRRRRRRIAAAATRRRGP